MKFLKIFSIPLLLIVICGVLLRSAYLEVKDESISQLNRQQMVMAREAARGIESFFAHYGELLKILAGQDHISSFDEQGELLLQIIYETHATEIKAITRVDVQGNVLCTFPENPRLTNLAMHEHVQKVIQTHQPVVGDVFSALIGSEYVAFHVPVFDKGAFAGSLGILIPFNDLAKRYLDDIRIGEDGYAWMISPKGVELYCPVPGHVGKSVFENCRDFPTILSMAEEMVQRKVGTTTYVYDRIRGQAVESVKKHAVYLPVNLGNTFWSIVVATPEDEVLGIIQGFRDRWFLIAGFLMVMTMVWAYYFLRAVTVLKEVEERKRAEEALISANQQLNDIIEFLPDATFVIDNDKRIIAWNRAIEEMTGVSKKDMIGKGDYAYTVPFYGERRSHLLDLLDASDEELTAKYQNLKKKGDILSSETFVPCVYGGKGAHVFATGAPLFDAHGNRVGAIESIRDITDRKLLESHLFQAQKMEAIGTLAGGVAHDFNNILAAIIGYTEMTKTKVQQEELRGYLERVLKACDRAKNLVGQILAFSRAGGHEIRPIDIDPLVNEGLKLLRATLPTTIEIRRVIASRLHTVLADPTQVHQVLLNLCTNAAHAMRERGGVLEVKLENVDIARDVAALSAELAPGPYVKLAVADTGIGIAPEVIHRIFDPFFTTKQHGEGTGLGLSVVYGIVRGCGGTIAVESEPGAGSVFTAYLPAIVEDVKTADEPSKSIPRGHERILLVDDEEILIDMGRVMLEDLGYKVTATSDSSKALEIFRTQPDQFDLVITDMTMPGMTGADLSRELLQLRPDIPIILCTGYNEHINEEKAKVIGLRGFALKPLSLSFIATLISQVLEKKQTLR